MEKKSGIQPILKSNSTSFWGNNCFPGMNAKKVTSVLKTLAPGDAGGKWRNHLISSLKWNIVGGAYILVEIVFRFCWLHIIVRDACPSLPSLRCPENWRFWSLRSLLLAQFSTHKHPTMFITKRKEVGTEKYPDTPIQW